MQKELETIRSAQLIRQEQERRLREKEAEREAAAKAYHERNTGVTPNRFNIISSDTVIEKSDDGVRRYKDGRLIEFIPMSNIRSIEYGNESLSDRSVRITRKSDD